MNSVCWLVSWFWYASKKERSNNVCRNLFFFPQQLWSVFTLRRKKRLAKYTVSERIPRVMPGNNWNLSQYPLKTRTHTCFYLCKKTNFSALVYIGSNQNFNNQKFKIASVLKFEWPIRKPHGISLSLSPNLEEKRPK